jgi:hypothetical protein
MPLDFPSSPLLNDLYTFGGKTWKWDGAGWKSYNIGLTGPQGPQGIPGPTGPTGPAGSGVIPGGYVSTLNGFTGGITLAAGDGINISSLSNIITIENQLYILIDGGIY